MAVGGCLRCGAMLDAADGSAALCCATCDARRARDLGDEGNGAIAAAPSGEVALVANTARIPMTEVAILDLLHRHVGVLAALFLAPDVPASAERIARRLHGSDLTAEERVLALFDASILGTYDEGFVITPARLCWRNASAAAQSIEWRAIDGDALAVEGTTLYLGSPDAGGPMHVAAESEVVDALANVIYVLSISARPAVSGFARAAHADISVPPALSAPRSGLVLPPPPRAKEPPPSEATPAESASLRAPTYATPPPPHAVSYDAYAVHASSQRGPAFGCWRCKTPLYWKTPQCSFCGAHPKDGGWIRMG